MPIRVGSFIHLSNSASSSRGTVLSSVNSGRSRSGLRIMVGSGTAMVNIFKRNLSQGQGNLLAPTSMLPLTTNGPVVFVGDSCTTDITNFGSRLFDG